MLSHFSCICVARIVKYTKNKFSLLKSKIRELHPVHRAALEALLQHLLRVSSHSDKNGLSVKILSSQFCKYILGFDSVFEGGVYVKARCINLL